MRRWLVFGRTQYPVPLQYQGEVEASDAEAAVERALARHGKEWVELSLIPEDAVRWVFREPVEEAV
jgi:1,2-phenylacetyl-CoA epoxidase PaaB subunit